MAFQSPHAARIAALLQKLSVVRKQQARRRKDPDLEHDYTLSPPLQMRSVVQFERRHGVELPEEFRHFLLVAGRGGAGPGFGLMTPSSSVRRNRKLQPAAPFPFSTAQAMKVGAERLIAKNKSAMLDGWTQPGTLTLTSHGCGWENAIVLSGPQRGFVWYGGDGWWPEGHVAGRGKSQRFVQLGFLDWYEDWLDASIR
jgi:hypothetical protein